MLKGLPLANIPELVNWVKWWSGKIIANFHTLIDLHSKQFNQRLSSGNIYRDIKTRLTWKINSPKELLMILVSRCVPASGVLSMRCPKAGESWSEQKADQHGRYYRVRASVLWLLHMDQMLRTKTVMMRTSNHYLTSIRIESLPFLHWWP